MRHRATQILAMVALFCTMLAGLAYILQRHVQQTESFPAYSSFRTLPEGASILYEALRRTPGMTAGRNTQPLGTLHDNSAAILMLGMLPAEVSANGQWFSDMEELAGRGNRMIIGLQPHRNRFLQGSNTQVADALKRWNVQLAFVLPTDVRDEEEDRLMAGWPMYFAQSKGWTITRTENGRAVVIERAEGKGSLVLLANSYLLTNAAMVDDRQTSFLANLFGPVHQVTFDETHFGIEETGSIAALSRRYRLQGLLLGLAITAALFVWKSAAGFPPPSASNLQPPSVTGEDSSAAFLESPPPQYQARTTSSPPASNNGAKCTNARPDPSWPPPSISPRAVARPRLRPTPKSNRYWEQNRIHHECQLRAASIGPRASQDRNRTSHHRPG